MMDLSKTLQWNTQRRSSACHPVSSILNPRFSPRAFTLIELMISIALVLLLILGVNQVFTYTTQAVGAGEAINSAIRSGRAAQAQMSDDFAGLVPNGTGVNDAGSIIISSRAYYAFRDAKDQAAQGPTSPNNYFTGSLPRAAFLDLNGDGYFGDSGVNGEIVWPANYNHRNHRLDTLSFFSRGLFHRQTGSGPPTPDSSFVSNMASQEAWIWYGHLQLPDNNGNDMQQDYPNSTIAGGASTFPCMGGDGTNGSNAANPNNCYGSQLVLGRMATLLLPTNGPTSTYQIRDSQGYPQWFVGVTNTYFPVLFENSPLITTEYPPASPEQTKYALPDSRVDLASGTIYSLQQILANYIATQPAGTDWWDQMLAGSQKYAANCRFKCNPFVSKPISSQAMSQASPYFLGGCSQFIVEFAGDFLVQDNNPSDNPVTNPLRTRTNYGDLTALGADGQIDFTVTYPNGPNQPPVKQIKWYGLPRSTSGNTTINAANGDVVPFRDWLQTVYNNPTNLTIAAALSSPSWEHNPPALAEYTNQNYSGMTGMSVAEAQGGYTCAFGPNDPHPKLIRITLTLDDPTGRLPNGQSYQYVFALP